MIYFPNAKINIGLNIVAKRPDGYHDIETVFYPIPLEDALEFSVQQEGAATSLTVTGLCRSTGIWTIISSSRHTTC